MPTPTLKVLVIPTGTLTTELATSLAETLAAPAIETATGCVPNQLEITSPKPGQEVSGIVVLIGTVGIPNLGFYKYEIAPQGSENWSTISAGRDAKVNESLGKLYAKEFPPGEYLLRLVASDNQGQSFPPCIVPIRVIGEGS